MRTGELDDRLMERDVRIRVLVQVLGRRRAVKLVEHVAQRADAFIRRVDRGEPRRHALERRADFDDLDDLFLGFPDDEDAAARNGAQEAFLLEQRHRLADRRPADAERAAQLTFVETNFLSAAVDVRVHNRFFERRVRLVDDADVRVEGLEVQLRRGLHVDFDWYTTYGMPF